jgi:hypothetical protein
MTSIEPITCPRARYDLMRNTSARPRIVARNAMIGTVGGSIRSLGAAPFIRPLTIPDPIIAIVGPMLDPERMGRDWNRSCGWSVGGLLPRNLSPTIPIGST